MYLPSTIYKLSLRKPLTIARQLYSFTCHKCLNAVSDEHQHQSAINVRNFYTEGKVKPGEYKPGVKIKDVTKAGQPFREVPDKDKQTFLSIVDNAQAYKFIKREGYIEFVTAAIPYLKEYGVHKDLDSYKALMRIFPNDGRYSPQNIIQAGFGHYIRQQRCALELLEEMNYYDVMPDKEMEKLVIETFGKHSYVWRKLARMNYWMTKLKNKDPYYMPEDDLPVDALELAIVAMKRMTVDVQTRIAVFSTAQVEDSIDKTWIVSAQSPAQKEILSELPKQENIYVEGPFRIYLRNLSLSYFILKAASDVKQIIGKSSEEQDDSINDVSNIPINIFGGKPKASTISPQKHLHIQDDGKILALAATGTSSRESLLSWIRLMQASNDHLRNLQVIFTLKAPSSDLETVNTVNEKKDNNNNNNNNNNEKKEET